jgi:hypothetical protein
LFEHTRQQLQPALQLNARALNKIFKFERPFARSFADKGHGEMRFWAIVDHGMEISDLITGEFVHDYLSKISYCVQIAVEIWIPVLEPVSVSSTSEFY